MSDTARLMIHRREALRRAACLLGGAISAPTIEGVLAGCHAFQRPKQAVKPATTKVTRNLSRAQRETVLAMAEHILPETDTPGARTARVDLFIDAMLTGYYGSQRRDRFVAGLEGVDARARRVFGGRFLKLAPAQQLELVTALNREAFQPDAGRGATDSFFRTFKELVIVGYYTSEVGATGELRLNPSGPWRADIPYAEVGRSWA
jgi:hypothetical protein